MSEIFNHGERGDSLKNRALNPFAGALAALMMTVGGQKSLAAPTTPLNDPKKPQTEQVEEGKGLRNTVESTEKEKQEITILAGDDDIENFLKNGCELPYVPHGTTIQGKDILEQVKDKQWPIGHRRVRFFLSNNIDNQPIRLDLKNIKDINGGGKYNDIKIGSIEGDCIQTEPGVLEIKGPSLVGLNYTDENGDYQSIFVTFNVVPNLTKIKGGESIEIAKGEEISYINSNETGLSPEDIQTLLGENIKNLTPSDDISLSVPVNNHEDLIASFCYAKAGTDPKKGSDPKTWFNEEGPRTIGEEIVLGKKIRLEDFFSNEDPLFSKEKKTITYNGKEYEITLNKRVIKVVGSDNQSWSSPYLGGMGIGNTFGIISIDIKETPINKITPSIEIKNPEMGSISLLNEKNEEVSELEEGKKYTLKADPKKGYQLSYLKLNDSIQTTNPVTFTCGKVVKIEAAFEKIETPIEKITPTVEITGTGEGTTTFLDENGTPVTELEVGKKYTINVTAAPKSEIKNITLNNTDISITNTSNMEYSFTCEKPCEWIITINKITSNNEVNNTFRIATQPGKLILSTQTPQAVQVYDMNGTLKYYNRNLQGEEYVNLTTGIYLIKTDQGSQKVIIQ